MTEAEWLTCGDPAVMFEQLTEYASERKLLLFACACSRQPWAAEYAARCESLLERVERHADGLLSAEEQWAARRIAYPVGLIGLLNWKAEAVGRRMKYPPGSGGPEAAREADLVRELFGNPWHTGPVDPAWRAWNGHTVPKLAQAIYETRAFERLPILADALEEAGCTDAAILGHCRGPGPHVRGCWVLDLLLGKA
jgi:hypothetical protein